MNSKPFVGVILALSFGKPSGCIANRQIAGLVRLKAGSKTDIVADSCIKIKDRKIFLIGDEDEETHQPTVDLIQDFLHLNRMKNWKRVLIVTADPYSKRVFRDMKKMCPKRLKLEVLNAKQYDWFFPDSNQIWTRHKKLDQIYEWILVNILPFWLYKWFTRKFA